MQPISGPGIRMTYFPGLALLCLAILLGLGCFRDYGISWDEPAQRGSGRITYNYVFHGDKTLLTYDDRGYGTGFELPLYMAETMLHQQDPRTIFETRHLLTHLFFLLAAFCGYLLALHLFRNQFLACLGFVMIVLEPRIYAHSFFNSKDLPFLSAYLIAMLCFYRAYEKKRIVGFLLLGIACGYATSIRAMGILPAAIVFFFSIVDLASAGRQGVSRRDITVRTLVFFAAFAGSLYVCWPLLWSDPVGNFISSFKTLSDVGWNGKVLFNGQMYGARELPYSYTPVWLLISIPEVWLLAGVAGTLMAIVNMSAKSRTWLSETRERNFVFYCATLLLPATAMAVRHIGNIDDWRHLYFIYPSMVMLALYACHRLMHTQYKWLIPGLCAAQLAVSGYFMISYHPYEQVYFNNFVSHGPEYLRRHFDLEYWGASYKEGMNFIAENDKRDSIAVYGLNEPVASGIRMLPAADRKRLIQVGDPDRADYFITNFRMHPDDFQYPHVVYEREVLNSTILRVYRIR